MRAESAAPTIGAFTAACVLVSNAVGSGIFTTTGFLARDLGDPGWVASTSTCARPSAPPSPF